MSKPSLLAIDTIDDRREVWHLLHRLPPRRRVAFLAACCEKVKDKHGDGPQPSWLRMRETVEQAYRCDRADLRLTNLLYLDFLVLGSQWKLDLAAAAVTLEAWVRRPSAA